MRRSFRWHVAIGVICIFVFSATAGLGMTREEVAQGIARYIMGFIYDLHGLTDKAIEEYEQAAAVDRENYLIHLRLGSDYANAGNLAAAIDQLERAKKYNPDDLQAPYLLALIYSTQREFTKAASEYESILTRFSVMDPKNVDVYTYLGQLYYSQEKLDKALEQFQRVLALEPKNAEVMSIIASLHLEMGKRAEAMDFFRKAISVDPEHEVSLNSLGYMYAEDNINLDEAQALVERALALDPTNGAYLDSLGWVYFKKHNYDKALEYLTKASEALKDPIIYEHLGDVYYAMSHADKAREYWKRSLELLPEQESVIKKLNMVLK